MKNMNKFASGALILCSAVALGGCGVPEKTRVTMPKANPPASQQASTTGATTADTAESKVSPAPLYFELDEKDKQPGFVEENLEVVLPSMSYVNDRLFEYGRKLDRWKELDRESASTTPSEEDAAQMVRCFKRLQNVLNGYGNLRTKLLQAQQIENAEEIGNSEIFDLQKNDIEFLEGPCGQLLATAEVKQSAGWTDRQQGADLSQQETLIGRYSANNEYEEVVQVWQQIPEGQVGRVHLQSKIQYGNALMFLHQERKAAAIYQEVVDQMSASKEQPTDLVSLRKVLADLYTASGDYQRALEQYGKISDDYQNLGKLEEWSKLQLSILQRSGNDSPELSEFSTLLRDYLGFIPERDGYKVLWEADKFLTNYPYSPVSSNVDFIKSDTQARADKWFNGFISQVDNLGAEKKFPDALKMMETIPTDIVGPEKQAAIKEKNEELLLAEAVEKETEKMAKVQDLQHQWNNGMLLAKNGRYDEAISVFTNLIDTEYGTKAEAKIKEVSLEAAKNDRKQAASMFQRYIKTTDLESRKKLLIETRKLLKAILVKYPDVEIGPKVIGNIARVEQEMNAIDPNLVQMADQQGSSTSPGYDGVDQAFNPPAVEQQPASMDDEGTGVMGGDSSMQ